MRRRALFGLAGVVLLLIGYALGRWQDTPAPVVLPPAATGTSAPQSPPAAEASPSAEVPSPTVYPVLQAEEADGNEGTKTEDTRDEGGGKDIGFIANGDAIRFDNVDFGPVPATRVDVRLSSAADPDRDGRIEIRLDSRAAQPAGSLRVTPTGDWQKWRTDEATITPVTGVHTVFLVFVRNDDDEFVNVNWLQFGH